MKFFIVAAISILVLTAGCKSSSCSAYGNYDRNRKNHSYIKTSEKKCKKPNDIKRLHTKTLKRK